MDIYFRAACRSGDENTSQRRSVQTSIRTKRLPCADRSWHSYNSQRDGCGPCEDWRDRQWVSRGATPCGSWRRCRDCSQSIHGLTMLHIRPARIEEVPQLEKLIARSIRTLGANDYTPAQIEGALRGAFGVDTQLIRDQTYFVVEMNGEMAGCGGWSYRQ